MRSAKPNWRRSYFIGRSPSADVVLSHDGVSRRHAKLVLDAQGGLYLADLGSKRGTFVHRDGGWQRLQHDFVGEEEPVRFGIYRTTPAQLLEQIARRSSDRSTAGSSQIVGTSHRAATILVADVVSYSRMMSQDPDGTLDALKSCRRDAVDPAILHHRGRIFGEAGDAVCAEFRFPADAVRAAHSIQSALRGQRFGGARKRVVFRIGIHAGDVMVEGSNLFGSAVNIAARLQALSQPGRFCISALVKDKATGVGLAFVDLGEKVLKNIPYPIRVFEVEDLRS